MSGSGGGGGAGTRYPQPTARSSSATEDGAAGGAAAPAQGVMIGNYWVGATLGQGTFGKVKAGTHVLTGESVAVKILEKSRIREVADAQRVAREIKILKRARHPNVIQLFEVIDTPRQILLVMEHCDSGELFDYIVRHQRLREDVAVRFFHDVVDGLSYLHRKEVAHRDLKPENILMDRRESGGYRLKIIDFGLSNTFDGGRMLKTACGSPCYAAPELLTHQPYNGPPADTWSLGVVLFAMVCGYLPYEDASTAKLYDKILRADYKTPKWISGAVRDLIGHIFVTDPAKRFNINDIRRHPWYTQLMVPTSPIKIAPTAVSDLHAPILDALEAMGVDRTALVDNLLRNAHNHITAAYFLLLERLARGGNLPQVAITALANAASASAANRSGTGASGSGSGATGSIGMTAAVPTTYADTTATAPHSVATRLTFAPPVGGVESSMSTVSGASTPRASGTSGKSDAVVRAASPVRRPASRAATAVSDGYGAAAPAVTSGSALAPPPFAPAVRAPSRSGRTISVPTSGAAGNVVLPTASAAGTPTSARTAGTSGSTSARVPGTSTYAAVVSSGSAGGSDKDEGEVRGAASTSSEVAAAVVQQRQQVVRAGAGAGAGASTAPLIATPLAPAGTAAAAAPQHRPPSRLNLSQMRAASGMTTAVSPTSAHRQITPAAPVAAAPVSVVTAGTPAITLPPRPHTVLAGAASRAHTPRSGTPRADEGGLPVASSDSPTAAAACSTPRAGSGAPKPLPEVGALRVVDTMPSIAPSLSPSAAARLSASVQQQGGLPAHLKARSISTGRQVPRPKSSAAGGLVESIIADTRAANAALTSGAAGGAGGAAGTTAGAAPGAGLEVSVAGPHQQRMVPHRPLPAASTMLVSPPVGSGTADWYGGGTPAAVAGSSGVGQTPTHLLLSSPTPFLHPHATVPPVHPERAAPQAAEHYPTQSSVSSTTAPIGTKSTLRASVASTQCDDADFPDLSELDVAAAAIVRGAPARSTGPQQAIPPAQAADELTEVSDANVVALALTAAEKWVAEHSNQGTATSSQLPPKPHRGGSGSSGMQAPPSMQTSMPTVTAAAAAARSTVAQDASMASTPTSAYLQYQAVVGPSHDASSAQPGTDSGLSAETPAAASLLPQATARSVAPSVEGAASSDADGAQASSVAAQQRQLLISPFVAYSTASATPAGHIMRSYVVPQPAAYVGAPVFAPNGIPRGPSVVTSVGTSADAIAATMPPPSGMVAPPRVEEGAAPAAETALGAVQPSHAQGPAAAPQGPVLASTLGAVPVGGSAANRRSVSVGPALGAARYRPNSASPYLVNMTTRSYRPTCAGAPTLTPASHSVGMAQEDGGLVGHRALLSPVVGTATTAATPTSSMTVTSISVGPASGVYRLRAPAPMPLAPLGIGDALVGNAAASTPLGQPLQQVSVGGVAMAFSPSTNATATRTVATGAPAQRAPSAGTGPSARPGGRSVQPPPSEGSIENVTAISSPAQQMTAPQQPPTRPTQRVGGRPHQGARRYKVSTTAAAPTTGSDGLHPSSPNRTAVRPPESGVDEEGSTVSTHGSASPAVQQPPAVTAAATPFSNANTASSSGGTGSLMMPSHKTAITFHPGHADGSEVAPPAEQALTSRTTARVSAPGPVPSAAGVASLWPPSGLMTIIQNLGHGDVASLAGMDASWMAGAPTMDLLQADPSLSPPLGPWSGLPDSFSPSGTAMVQPRPPSTSAASHHRRPITAADLKRMGSSAGARARPGISVPTSSPSAAAAVAAGKSASAHVESARLSPIKAGSHAADAAGVNGSGGLTPPTHILLTTSPRLGAPHASAPAAAAVSIRFTDGSGGTGSTGAEM